VLILPSAVVAYILALVISRGVERKNPSVTVEPCDHGRPAPIRGTELGTAPSSTSLKAQASLALGDSPEILTRRPAGTVALRGTAAMQMRALGKD
jgi:hypothetical protein